jgi:hypothetical protein
LDSAASRIGPAENAFSYRLLFRQLFPCLFRACVGKLIVSCNEHGPQKGILRTVEHREDATELKPIVIDVLYHMRVS